MKADVSPQGQVLANVAGEFLTHVSEEVQVSPPRGH